MLSLFLSPLTDDLLHRIFARLFILNREYFNILHNCPEQTSRHLLFQPLRARSSAALHSISFFSSSISERKGERRKKSNPQTESSKFASVASGCAFLLWLEIFSGDIVQGGGCERRRGGKRKGSSSFFPRVAVFFEPLLQTPLSLLTRAQLGKEKEPAFNFALYNPLSSVSPFAAPVLPLPFSQSFLSLSPASRQLKTAAAGSDRERERDCKRRPSVRLFRLSASQPSQKPLPSPPITRSLVLVPCSFASRSLPSRLSGCCCCRRRRLQQQQQQSSRAAKYC